MHLVDFLWTLFVIYFMVIYFLMLFRVITDVFRSDDLSGGMKAVWLLALLVVPLLTLIVYVIARGHGMAERQVSRYQQLQEQQADYIRSAAGGGGAAEEIERAHGLLTSGAISQEEFAAIKAKALA